jgi:alkanesulfonate monooxygenase SsuD/methylene tetrahydromethanopterin reductase-like flavin-dependent oxidoreductase (luciferase family)
VGFALELATTDTPADASRHVLASGQLAEALGFDAVLLPDHPTFMPDCWLHLAALTARTQRVRLGTNVACALYRHPVLLARLATDLDNLSGGRLVLGLGAGWNASEFGRLGLVMPPASVRQAALSDTIAILDGIWGSEPFTYTGAYFSATRTRVSPSPVQQPRPPILVAGGGERGTLRQVAQFADACQIGDFGLVNGASDTDALRNKLEVLRRQCTMVGRDYASVLRTHFTGWLILANDRYALEAKVARYAPRGLDQRYPGPWSGYAVAVTPDEAVAYYQARVAVGIQYFVIQLMDASDVETIQLLAEKVIPSVNMDALTP